MGRKPADQLARVHVSTPVEIGVPSRTAFGVRAKWRSSPPIILEPAAKGAVCFKIPPSFRFDQPTKSLKQSARVKASAPGATSTFCIVEMTSGVKGDVETAVKPLPSMGQGKV